MANYSDHEDCHAPLGCSPHCPYNTQGDSPLARQERRRQEAPVADRTLEARPTPTESWSARRRRMADTPATRQIPIGDLTATHVMISELVDEGADVTLTRLNGDLFVIAQWSAPGRSTVPSRATQVGVGKSLQEACDRLRERLDEDDR